MKNNFSQLSSHYLASQRVGTALDARMRLVNSNEFHEEYIPEKLKVPHLAKKFPALCGIWRFITVFETAYHISISGVRLIQFMPSRPISLRSLSYYLLMLYFLSSFPAKFCMYLSSPAPI